MENQWNSSEKNPWIHHVADSREVQRMMCEMKCTPEQDKGRIIFISMYNDIIWRDLKNEEICVVNSINVANYARRFPFGHWSSLGPASEKTWNGTDT